MIAYAIATEKKMKKMIVVPDGWPMALSKCLPGFFVHKHDLYLISEYRTNNESTEYEAFCSSGEYCCLDSKTVVQPVRYEWEEDDE